MLAQDPSNIKLPATHLKSILVEMKSNEQSNQPRYVGHKRRNSKYFKRSSSVSSVWRSAFSSYDELNDQKTKTEIFSNEINNLKNLKVHRNSKNNTSI